MDMPNIIITNSVNATGDDSSIDTNVNDSISAEDQIFTSRPLSPSLEQALTTYIPNAFNNHRQQRIEQTRQNQNLLNVLSRVTIAVAKYPNDATLHNYSDLQMWMYTHTNKRAPVDICQSLHRMFMIHTDHYDHDVLFNLYLICTEAYQTIGNTDQAICQYNEAEIIAKILDDTRTIRSSSDITERERKRQKLKEIGMKLEFQSRFRCNLVEGSQHRSFNSMRNNFIAQLKLENPNAEECPYIWRQIVLQSALNPSVAIVGAEWLLSYAARLQRSTLQHANSLYVALNLFLFGYGPAIFRQRININVFKILDDISRYFQENGNQSKQFPPIHKMAHVWGTAAVAFKLAFDEYKYLVCASIMRVSFESLNICFLSSGVESLYLLARTHTPTFFNMMTIDPGVKLISPQCINYFRRQIENNQTCIPYSTEAVNQFVLDVFNIDQTNTQV